MQSTQNTRRPHRAFPFQEAILACGLVLLAPAAGAGEASRPGIIGDDDRTILAETGSPWDAVGQVNIGGFRSTGQCTGTLVAPRIVITAAHCLIDAAGRPFPLGDIHFLAAVRGSDHKGHATARCLRFASGPEGSEVSTPSNPRILEVARDAAAIVLAEDLAVNPAELGVDAASSPGLRLTHVAYPGDRRYVPVIHKGCRLLAAVRVGPIWFNDCDTHPGSSGGPLFVEEEGTYKVAAIQVAAGSRGANLAVPLATWTNLVADAPCP